VQLPIKHELPDVVARIKSNSCKLIREAGWPDFAWQRGYGVFTTDSLPRLQKYIASQKTHHLTQDYEDEFITLIQSLDAGGSPRYTTRSYWASFFTVFYEHKSSSIVFNFRKFYDDYKINFFYYIAYFFLHN